MSIALTLIAALVAFPSAVLFLQCLVAILPSRDRSLSGPIARPNLGVLVPAHNEEAVIRGTLESIGAQLIAGDRLLVVADNCSDATEAVAAALGAQVLARHDPTRRGKGYALQAGLDVLRENPPAVVVVIDADCRLETGCLQGLAAQVAATSRPAQGGYVMLPPANPQPIDVVSALAVLVKNRVRPLAMTKLGLPCLLTGSGCAFPWQALEARPFEATNIVEDMQLSVDLALAGLPPAFCDRAKLSALLPDRPTAFLSQRRRWEHGHLQTLATQVPRLLLGFLKSGRIDQIAMMADLAVPPLSLLVAITIGLLVIAVIAGAVAATSWVPAMVLGGAGLLVSTSIGLAWWGFARGQIPLRNLLAIPAYVLAKLPLYASFLIRRERSWIRTARGPAERNE